MRILRCPQHEVIAGFVNEVNQTRIAVRHVDDEIDDLAQYLIKVQSRTDRLADLVKNPQLLTCKVESLLDGFNGIVVSSHYY